MSTGYKDLQWSSTFLDFDAWVYGEAADKILLEDLVPVIEEFRERGWIDRWFFVRYHENCPHLRLRCRGRSEDLEREIVPRIHLATEATPRILGAREVPYEPEFDRYGGLAGLAVSEDLFHCSSEVAVDLLRSLPVGDRSARLGQAMLVKIVTLWAFAPDRDEVADMAWAYGHGYLRALAPDSREQASWLEAFAAGLEKQASHLTDYIEAAWEALADGQSLTPRLDPWRDEVTAAAERFRALCQQGELWKDGEPCTHWQEASRFLAASHLHMMNNRLGIDIREESYLSVLIHHTLRPPGREHPRADPAQ